MYTCTHVHNQTQPDTQPLDAHLSTQQLQVLRFKITAQELQLRAALGVPERRKQHRYRQHAAGIELASLHVFLSAADAGVFLRQKGPACHGKAEAGMSKRELDTKAKAKEDMLPRGCLHMHKYPTECKCTHRPQGSGCSLCSSKHVQLHALGLPGVGACGAGVNKNLVFK